MLQRFRFTAQGYQEKFRTARAQDGEIGKQLAAWLSGYFDLWVEMAEVPKTYDDLRDHVISEQFLGFCCSKLGGFLRERKCKSLATIAEYTDRFLEAQCLRNLGEGADNAREPRQEPTAGPKGFPARCFLCDRVGHRAAECRITPKESPPNCKRGDEKVVACALAKRFTSVLRSSTTRPRTRVLTRCVTTPPL